MKAAFKNDSMNKIYLHTQTFIYTLYTGVVPACIQNSTSLKTFHCLETNKLVKN